VKYFEWDNEFERNNCRLSGLRNQLKYGEVYEGIPLAKKRKKPYVWAMDNEYKKNVRLTDSLMNDERTIVASPRLKELLAARVESGMEALPVHVLDHKGRVASKDYAIINILDLQDCLAVEESHVTYATMGGREVLNSVRELVLKAKKISAGSKLFRVANFTRKIVVREDLADELIKGKFEGIRLDPVRII
jgi:hypothetical protein